MYYLCSSFFPYAVVLRISWNGLGALQSFAACLWWLEDWASGTSELIEAEPESRLGEPDSVPSGGKSRDRWTAPHGVGYSDKGVRCAHFPVRVLVGQATDHGVHRQPRCSVPANTGTFET